MVPKQLASTRARGIVAARGPDAKWVNFIQNCKAPKRPSANLPTNLPETNGTRKEPQNTELKDDKAFAANGCNNEHPMSDDVPKIIDEHDEVPDLMFKITSNNFDDNNGKDITLMGQRREETESKNGALDAFKTPLPTEYGDEDSEITGHETIGHRTPSVYYTASEASTALTVQDASSKLMKMEEGLSPKKEKLHQEYVKMEEFAARWSVAPHKASTREVSKDKETIKLLSAMIREMGEELEKSGLSKKRMTKVLKDSKEQQRTSSMNMPVGPKKATVYVIDGKRWFTSFVPDYNIDPSIDSTSKTKILRPWQLKEGKSKIDAFFARFPTFPFDPKTMCHLNKTCRALMSHLRSRKQFFDYEEERGEFFDACAKDAKEIMRSRKSMHKYEKRTKEEKKWHSWLCGKGTKFQHMYRESLDTDEIVFEDEKHLPRPPQPKEKEIYPSGRHRCTQEFDDRFIWSWYHSSIFVNIFDYIEWIRHPDQSPTPTLFLTEQHLEDYCHESDKFFSHHHAGPTDLSRLIQLIRLDPEKLKEIRRAQNKMKGRSAPKGGSMRRNNR